MNTHKAKAGTLSVKGGALVVLALTGRATLLSTVGCRVMKKVFAQSIIISLFLSLAGCSPPMFTSYRPPGSTEAAWQVKAEKSLTGVVILTINNTEVLQGQFPGGFFSGTREFKGQYQGRDVVMILTTDAIKSVWMCRVFVHGDLVGDFTWDY